MFCVANTTKLYTLLYTFCKAKIQHKLSLQKKTSQKKSTNMLINTNKIKKRRDKNTSSIN